jgi:hypothetical protein
MKGFAVKSAQRTVRGLAEPEALFQNRSEHGCKIAGRGIDNLQHLRNRGFPRQRLVAFAPEFGDDLRRLGRWRSNLRHHPGVLLTRRVPPPNFCVQYSGPIKLFQSTKPRLISRAQRPSDTGLNWR